MVLHGVEAQPSMLWGNVLSCSFTLPQTFVCMMHTLIKSACSRCRAHHRRAFRLFFILVQKTRRPFTRGTVHDLVHKSVNWVDDQWDHTQTKGSRHPSAHNRRVLNGLLRNRRTQCNLPNNADAVRTRDSRVASHASDQQCLPLD